MRRLRADGLQGTISYSDGQFDDARYSLALVQSAAQSGAVVGFEKNQSGKVIAANVFDRLSGRSVKVKAQTFVNATGAVSDHVRQLANPQAEPRLQPSKGVHILLPLPGDFGVEAL